MMSHLHAIFFSATDTTRRSVDAICHGYGADPDFAINLADNLQAGFPTFNADDTVLVAAPVYGGRLPTQVAEAFKRLRGGNATAIAVVVFGNRDYDDALLEMTDILSGNGFRIVASGAFIGQHSIFPKVASSRPDADDLRKLMAFGNECRNAVAPDGTPYPPLSLKGKRPYKTAAGISLHPTAKKADCLKCGRCVTCCPVGAIPADKPYVTDTSLCITCGRCINICTTGARHHSGLTYRIIGALFKAGFSTRKDPEWTIAK